MMSAQKALQALQEGNHRFVKNMREMSVLADGERRRELVTGQNPFAIILGCSDSRVPAEIVFDQGLGDLFVIRVAGNIVAPSLIGSVEFAADRFGTPLVVVLGHSMCGAVVATIEELERPTENRSPNLHAIVERIQPSVSALLAVDRISNREELIQQAVRENIRTSVMQLRSGSRILEELIRKQKLMIVGAEYSLETGVVDFFEGVT